MNITRGLPPAPLAAFPVLSIGNFDGQHIGHRALIEAVIEQAQRFNGVPMVLSFDPHPIEVLRPSTLPKFYPMLKKNSIFSNGWGSRSLFFFPSPRPWQR